MARDLDDALTRSWAVSTTAVGLLLALVLPVLVGTAADGGVAGMTLLALAVAVLLAFGRPHLSQPAYVVFVRSARPSGSHVGLNGRITDPPHHPLRPRAPGMR